MIIQSDSVRMGATRRFSSTQSTYYRASGSASSDNLMISKSSVYSRRELYASSQNRRSVAIGQSAEKLPEDTENVEDTKNTENEAEASGSDTSGKNNLSNLMERMKGSSGARRISLRSQMDSYTRIRQQSLNYLLYILFGKRSIENDMNIPTEEEDRFEDVLAEASAEKAQTPAASTQSKPALSYYFYYNEEENTCFDAQGTAVTADGRELSFNISLEMSRSFTMETSQQINFLQPVLCDPLVINLDSNVASVSDQKFFFDIDADGKEESVSMLNSGSGYLALDKNGDGKINDGSELFGTASGNGFKDLSAYDRDQNGWIDEADEIFQKLRIWTKDANGNDQLLTLSEAGVGAIYLGYENTDFALNSMKDNSTNAMIRKTGIFLYENGGSGTVQQLDLAT